MPWPLLLRLLLHSLTLLLGFFASLLLSPRVGPVAPGAENTLIPWATRARPWAPRDFSLALVGSETYAGIDQPAILVELSILNSRRVPNGEQMLRAVAVETGQADANHFKPGSCASDHANHFRRIFNQIGSDK